MHFEEICQVFLELLAENGRIGNGELTVVVMDGWAYIQTKALYIGSNGRQGVYSNKGIIY